MKCTYCKNKATYQIDSFSVQDIMSKYPKHRGYGIIAVCGDCLKTIGERMYYGLSDYKEHNA